MLSFCFFFFKQKTAYEMRISDWSSDVCSSDLLLALAGWNPGAESPWLARERHVHALQLAAEHLATATEHAAQDDRVLDLFAEELRLAHDSLTSITGRFTSDDLLGEIFSSFCIGK